MTSNPNTVAALLAGGGAWLSQWLFARYAHLGLSREHADMISGALVLVVLWVGRTGVKGALRRIWGGASSAVAKATGATKAVWAGSQPATPAEPPAKG